MHIFLLVGKMECWRASKARQRISLETTLQNRVMKMSIKTTLLSGQNRFEGGCFVTLAALVLAERRRNVTRKRGAAAMQR